MHEVEIVIDSKSPDAVFGEILELQWINHYELFSRLRFSEMSLSIELRMFLQILKYCLGWIVFFLSLSIFEKAEVRRASSKAVFFHWDTFCKSRQKSSEQYFLKKKNYVLQSVYAIRHNHEDARVLVLVRPRCDSGKFLHSSLRRGSLDSSRATMRRWQLST